MNVTKKTLLTCALPYANGPIHLGHMVEHIQADIYARFRKSAGDEIVFVCADDTHGSPIELAALKAGVTPEAYVAAIAVEHQRDFKDFHIGFDFYGSTNSDENRQYAELIYGRAKEAGSIGKKEVEQPYDAKMSDKELFDNMELGAEPTLPDLMGTYTHDELVKKIANGVAASDAKKWNPKGPLPMVFMPVWKDKISKHEMDDLATWLLSTAKKDDSGF